MGNEHYPLPKFNNNDDQYGRHLLRKVLSLMEKIIDSLYRPLQQKGNTGSNYLLNKTISALSVQIKSNLLATGRHLRQMY